jgi:hypothetical protein
MYQAKSHTRKLRQSLCEEAFEKADIVSVTKRFNAGLKRFVTGLAKNSLLRSFVKGAVLESVFLYGSWKALEGIASDEFCVANSQNLQAVGDAQ